MLDRFGRAAGGYVPERTLKSCLLRGTVGEPDGLARLAGQVARVGPDDRWYGMHQFAKGLHDYSTGRYAEALAACWESRTERPNEDDTPCRRAATSAVEAMALHRLGKAKEAAAAGRPVVG